MNNTLPLAAQLTEAQAQIYCCLYASTQELLKLTTLLERLFFLRSELALL